MAGEHEAIVRSPVSHFHNSLFCVKFLRSLALPSVLLTASIYNPQNIASSNTQPTFGIVLSARYLRQHLLSVLWLLRVMQDALSEYYEEDLERSGCITGMENDIKATITTLL